MSASSRNALHSTVELSLFAVVRVVDAVDCWYSRSSDHDTISDPCVRTVSFRDCSPLSLIVSSIMQIDYTCNVSKNATWGQIRSLHSARTVCLHSLQNCPSRDVLTEPFFKKFWLLPHSFMSVRTASEKSHLWSPTRECVRHVSWSFLESAKSHQRILSHFLVYRNNFSTVFSGSFFSTDQCIAAITWYRSCSISSQNRRIT